MPQLAVAPSSEPGLLATRAVVKVTDLRLRTYIGFNEEERTKQQDVIINLEIAYTPEAGIAGDDVASALDYKVLTKRIINHVEQGRFLLLEKLGHDILALCAEESRISKASVTVDKPHALRFADSVSVTLDYDQSTAPAA